MNATDATAPAITPYGKHAKPEPPRWSVLEDTADGFGLYVPLVSAKCTEWPELTIAPDMCYSRPRSEAAFTAAAADLLRVFTACGCTWRQVKDTAEKLLDVEGMQGALAAANLYIEQGHGGWYLARYIDAPELAFEERMTWGNRLDLGSLEEHTDDPFGWDVLTMLAAIAGKPVTLPAALRRHNGREPRRGAHSA